ncbi:hypothetical protein RRV45_19370 [Bacillus sp. DTU_2020_1000418_1_SI_GHA_SEK_038]|uniref:hypothetical protein n=1 Tax=Bacillus sp. DTU_2020_1000418_1_SI_GHA_SEK_038 TaxID=3077585 RepID=UPI0028ED500C|nr:hypothetical protein [Bacillus sp. DTU_2020_1000418_1_SI_GHA_SEK_038]WNS75017.1 hypothetical protein RRV45_19370 [Bacillus sp. DTU_2020_1000418_1_SI_GHA_SEK_038]
MKEFFTSKIGLQTIAFLVTLVSFPFLYVGGTQGNASLLNVGLVLMLAGMLAAPAITFIHGKKATEKATKKDVYRGVTKLKTREEQ